MLVLRGGGDDNRRQKNKKEEEEKQSSSEMDVIISSSTPAASTTSSIKGENPRLQKEEKKDFGLVKHRIWEMKKMHSSKEGTVIINRILSVFFFQAYLSLILSLSN